MGSFLAAGARMPALGPSNRPKSFKVDAAIRIMAGARGTGGHDWGIAG